MNEHEGDPLDETLREIATRYNEPPAAPRDEMWAMIQRRRADERTAPATEDRPALRLRQRRPELRWAAAIAAVLILGIGIGRFTAGGGEGTAPVIGTATPSANGSVVGTSSVALELTASRHLEQSETFLTLFRTAVATGRPTELAPGAARELLLSNRLLLDSPVTEDPRMRLLLQDLELVLAQIAQLPAEDTRGDADLITEGMDAGSMLPRLRLIMSEGASATLRQGAL